MFFVTSCSLEPICMGWSCRVHYLYMRILWFIYLYPVDTESRILRNIDTYLRDYTASLYKRLLYSRVLKFSHWLSTSFQTSRSLYSGTHNNIPEERSHFRVWSIISDMLVFVPLLCHHSCATWAVVNGQLPKHVSVSIWIVCLFVLLPLQPIVVVFSQPGSGL